MKEKPIKTFKPSPRHSGWRVVPTAPLVLDDLPKKRLANALDLRRQLRAAPDGRIERILGRRLEQADWDLSDCGMAHMKSIRGQKHQDFYHLVLGKKPQAKQD